MRTFKITDDGDLYIDPIGRTKYIYGHDKLSQDAEKIILTGRNILDAKRPDPEYGSDLVNLIGKAQASPTKTKLEVATAIRAALKKLKDIQDAMYANLANKAS